MGNRLPSPEGEGGTTPNDRFARSERAARTRPDPILEDRVPPAPVTPRRGNAVDWEQVLPTLPIASARPGGAAAAALAVRLRDRRADTGVLAIFPSSHLGSDCTAASAAATAAKTAAELGESRNWQAQSDNCIFFKKIFCGSELPFALCTQGLERPADWPRLIDSPVRRATALPRRVCGEAGRATSRDAPIR